MKSITQPKAWGFAALALLTALILLPGCNGQDASETHKESAAKKSAQATAAGEKDHSGKEDKHADHDEDEGEANNHGGAEGHDEHGGEEVVRLSPEELKEFGIEVATAGPGRLDQYAELPGEIVLNADRLAHVVPRVPGIVREVRRTVGDAVNTGELLAVIESRELADAKAAFLAAAEREKLALANFDREERLWRKKISSEQEYLDARRALAEARIARNSAEQQLHALGFSEDYLKSLPEHPDATYTRFEIRAPFAGTITEKHLALGENAKSDAEVFTIADLSSVWVDINVYQKDLTLIRQGQTVVIEIGHGIPQVSGKIAWVGPLVGEATRTAKARVVLANPEGTLRPGLFVTARVAVGNTAAGIVVPKSALQTFEERNVVFVQDEDGFEPRPVELGQKNANQVEILSGLEAGQTYVSQGAFTLKAQLSKGAFGDGHNH
ncbi:RND family efflux pump membrane fusion protein [Desulfuromonas sp. DDH964]|uniref:efflux RND transporter periplasmic adaptor subunit n=1 Tax=Desulfuromonas sp. DDH964 TaxID=1823759 RepID=UPI00078DB41C|nr:efflux RND transporter periplasmic adaptor subunit [Desulfuromonas sp. DDH964]AMV70616.1 RND family efflux pump membrane fusion protein [Desulfuromonas sp. DDH964]